MSRHVTSVSCGVSGQYGVAPLFSIRLAGTPFDVLDRLATPRSASLAKAIIAAERTITNSRGEPATADASTVRAKLSSELDQVLEEELNVARASLLDASAQFLPPYLVFGTGGVRELQQRLLRDGRIDGEPLPSRNAKAGDRERHLLMYLQRICAKNDTLSEWGPTVWGTIADKLRFEGKPGIAGRRAYLERWTAHAAAAAMNADPAVREELAPRIHPNGRLKGNRFVLTDTAEALLLDSGTLDLVLRCTGNVAAHSLGAPPGALEQLAERGVLRWQVEVAAMQSEPLLPLFDEVERWRDSPIRSHWLRLLRPIIALPAEFAAATRIAERVRLMDEARAAVSALGPARAPAHRVLYSATNPIGEECRREWAFQLNDQMTDRFAQSAAPWIDLWRDTYAFVASRVAAGLRDLLNNASGGGDTLALPAFLKHCETQRMSLTGPGIVVLAHLAFQEVKAAFRNAVSGRPDAPEWQLTVEDCGLVRRAFDFPKFDEYTYPSADLQISASSFAAVQRGDYRWIVSELHPPVAMLHHCFYWNCPDPTLLSELMARTVCGRPNFHFGFFPADFTSHTTVRIFETLPELSIFVAPQRADPNWKTVAPADAEVYVDNDSADVCLRHRDTHEPLGSFARSWLIPLGFHPFHFGRSPHMPRLVCGDVVVQRRSWTVSLEELRAGKYTGVSRDLIIAVERLRGDKDFPRYVYIRPTEAALRRSGAEGRDKDTKPVFIDLESYMFVEIFHRWLVKAGELEVTEMLPDPDHLCWQEADGRRTFELRTLIVPRS